MVEAWIKTASSRQLSGRRSKDTEPELLLRRALHRIGARFRLHRRIERGCNPDIVLPKLGVAVFVDGDFWHGCPKHFPDRRTGGPNAPLWQKKFEATRARDVRSSEVAQAHGWTVVRLWECEIRDDPDGAAAAVLAASV